MNDFIKIIKQGKMHSIKIFLCLLSISILGCNAKVEKNESQIKKSAIIQTNTQDANEGNENAEWLLYINSKSDSIENIYSENAIKVLSNNVILHGNKDIKNHLLSNFGPVKSIQSDTILLANQNRKIEYELGSYIDINNQTYKQIIIWETNNDLRQRVFEFAEKVSNTDNVLGEITESRKIWMALCNAHDAKALIDEMYSDNTLYFNHKPLIIGREQLAMEYQYMNNEKYTLTLTPITVESVNKKIVFEIGQCSGSYNGNYIIIWNKNKTGKWEVYIDSNI